MCHWTKCDRLRRSRLCFILASTLLVITEQSPAYTALPLNALPAIHSIATLGPGDDPRTRGLLSLVQSLITSTEAEKVAAVNRYFNDVIRFADDEVAWGVSDYWATLEQTLTKGTGDCDDIAIAKFLTLLALGVSRANLRLAVVKTKQAQRNHMVVIYLPASEKNTYLLDNLERELRVAPGAGAMHVVYSLDGRSLWMNDSRGKERRIGDASILAQWRGLLARISRPDLWRFYLA